jgi:hypothetical protein
MTFDGLTFQQAAFIFAALLGGVLLLAHWPRGRQ